MSRPGSEVPFVARRAEFDQLRAALARARSGTAAAVLVSGDAGVGKSRLLAEFADDVRREGAPFILGRCLGLSDDGLPYLPFKEIIEQLLTEHGDVVTTRAPLAALVRRAGGSVSAPAEEADLGQLQLFGAVLAALSEVSAREPMVLALEDLHWSDASTRDLLSFLLSRLSGQRVLIIGTYRSDDLHRRHPLRPLLAELVRLPVVERLDLAPFATDDAEAFVRALAGTAIDDAMVTDVAARSEGNAFYAEELFAASSAPGGAIPTALADLLMARVEALSPVAQRVAGAISVTGRQHVAHSALRAISGMDDAELDEGLREALQHHVLITDDDDAYTFRHALLREAVYADLLPGERVRLHAAYAARIREVGGDEFAPWLAYHSLRSNDLPTALAASVRAADEARHVGALSAELRHIEQALELWGGVDDPESHAGMDEFTLTRKAAYVAGAAGHPERSLAYARAAVALSDQLDDPVVKADVRRQLTESLLAGGQWEEAARTISEAWGLVEHTPPSPTRAWVLAIRARAHRPWFDDATRRSFAEEAAQDARESGAVSAEADALISMAFSDMHAGAIDHACELFEQARDRAVQAEAPNVELRALFNLVTTRYEQGQLDLAAQIADDGAARASELGLTWSPYGLELRWMQVMVHYARGSWSDALSASSPPGEPVSDTITALQAASGAMVKVGLGRFDEAERELTKVRPEWHRDGQIAQLAGIAGAELACWQGHPDVAASVVRDAIDSMRKASSSGWPMGGIRLAALGVAAQADLAQQARDRDDDESLTDAVATGEQLVEYAHDTVAHGTPRADQLGPEGLAWVARLRAEAGRLRGKSDPTAWREVVEAFGYGELYPVAAARWRLADALITDGDRDGAAAELAAAATAAGHLGARPLSEAIGQLARRARLTMPGKPAPTGELLTPREHAVLELVARGYTNRKVGEELFISEKTVSVHVSRVMTKLQATSRTEAVAHAYRQGLLDQPR